jgi:hypothetical protein
MVGVAVSTSLLSFRFEFQGLVGRLLEQQGNGKSVVAYSFDSVGWAMREAAGLSTDSIGRKQGNPIAYGLQSQIICMQICYCFFGLLAPLLLLIVLLVVWILPLTPSGLDTLLRFAGTVGAWSALDVFCVSIAAALLEIRQFASFMVGSNCSDIDSLSGYFLPPKAGQAPICFDVVATLSLVSSTCYLSQNSSIQKFCHVFLMSSSSWYSSSSLRVSCDKLIDRVYNNIYAF